MGKISDAVRSFSLSEAYPLILFVLVYGMIVLDLLLAAFCLLLLFCCVVCLCCDDLVPLLLPALLCIALAFLCQPWLGSVGWLFWVILPCAGALLYRFLRDVRRVRLGVTFPGLVAVSLALLLGGVGRLPASDYFSAASLYHIFGLGPLLLFLYLLIRSNVDVPRAYHVGDRIAGAMYLCAVLLGFCILRAYLMNADLLAGDGELSDIVQKAIPWRNLVANMMALLLPFVFYYARRQHLLHLLPACLLYLMMAVSGSRGAIVCGFFAMLLGVFYLVYHRRRAGLIVLSGLLAVAGLVFLSRGWIVQAIDELLNFHYFGFNGEHFFETNVFNLFNESRYKLWIRSIEDFRNAPLFGQGLGYCGNADIFANGKLTISWYHSMIPQIIGSMGIVGILAYGYQLFIQTRLALRMRHTAYAGALVMAYVNLLVYSQIDPGLFSPLPFGIMGVLFMTLLEVEAGEAGLLRRDTGFGRVFFRMFAHRSRAAAPGEK